MHPTHDTYIGMIGLPSLDITSSGTIEMAAFDELCPWSNRQAAYRVSQAKVMTDEGEVTTLYSRVIENV